MRVHLFLIVVAMLVPAVALAKVEVRPYGFVLINNSYNTDSPAEGLVDIPVFAPPDGVGEPTFVISPRQSRFGVKMKSDGKLKMSGAIEIDFWGLRGSQNPTNATQTAPRLRLAVLKLHFETWDLVVGQDWIVFSPLLPTTIMHQAVAGFTASGNLWARLPMVAGKFRLVDTDRSGLDFDLALTRPFGADQDPFPVRQFDQVGAGEKSQLPFLQSRLGYVLKGDLGLDLGLSVHAGSEDFGKNLRTDENLTGSSFGFCADVKFQVNKITIKGEGYSAQNVPMLFSSIGFKRVTTGTDPDTLLAVNEIKGAGGWGEIDWAFSSEWLGALLAGLESLDDQYLTAGDIKQNLTVMGSAHWKPVPEFKTALEVGWIQTKRISDTAAKTTDKGGTNVNVNLSFLYAF